MSDKKKKTVVIYEPCPACNSGFLDCHYYIGERGFSHTCTECEFEGINIEDFGCYEQRKDYEKIHGKHKE